MTRCINDYPWGFRIDSSLHSPSLSPPKIEPTSPENPRIPKIGDYWGGEEVNKITELLVECQDPFPHDMAGMKGMEGEAGVIRIRIEPDAKPQKRLNPNVEKGVRKGIEKMFYVGPVSPVGDSEWMSQVVIRNGIGDGRDQNLCGLNGIE